MSDYISKYFKTHHNQLATREQWKSEDASGNPIPWMTYSALFQLEQFDFSAADIFEWGGGFSSLYWAARCKSLNTVEHDPEWVAFVRDRHLANLTCHDIPLECYAEHIDSFTQAFDVIVVDGHIHEGMRMKCAQHALKHLKDGGLIILDNSDWLANTCAFLRSQGYNQSDYSGFGPINNYPWCTSLFHKGELKLPRKTRSPGFVPGGIQNVRD
jgi:predicted O-methyltransferase YrrM